MVKYYTTHWYWKVTAHPLYFFHFIMQNEECGDEITDSNFTLYSDLKLKKVNEETETGDHFT